MDDENHSKTNNNVDRDEKPKKSLKEKVFLHKESLITELYDIKHIKNIKHIFMMILVVLFTNQIVYSIVFNTEFNIGHMVLKDFNDMHYALLAWYRIVIVHLLIYPSFQLWSMCVLALHKNLFLQRLWNSFAVICFVFYIVKCLQYSANFVTIHNLSFPSSCALLCEQLRILMKGYAYVRSNISKVLNAKSYEDVKLANFKHYLYFFFVPTIIYKDSYPRKEKTDWNKVVMLLLELIGNFFLMVYIYENNFLPVCHKFKTSTYTINDILWSIFKNTLPSATLAVLCFYFLLHSWMNLFAELTRFADRRFYQDWWNAKSYSEYFRKWNIVVHDWLYAYIYKDIHDNLTPNSTVAPRIMVFFISSFFHEYVLYYSMRMFYPALFVIFFLIGMLLSCVKAPKYWIFNVIFIYTLSIGLSISITTYIMEFCVRQNDCVKNATTGLEFYHSRTYYSDCLVLD